MPTIIEVEGKADIKQAPERAILNFQVQHQGVNKREISERAIKEGNENANMIKGFTSLKGDNGAFCVTSWSMSTLSSDIIWQENKEEPQRYSVKMKLQAEFSDFGALSSAISKLSLNELGTISSIKWTLTEETKAKLISSVRKRAVASARERAVDYSEALGLEIIECHSITSYGEQPHHAAFGMRMMKAPQGQEIESLSLEPADVSLEVTINAKFAAGKRP